VPSIPPYNKVQVVQWAKHWPCTLVQPSVPPYIHSESEINSIETLFNQLHSGICFLLVPETGYVVRGEDGAESWKHCIMQAIDEFQVADGDYLCSKAVALMFDEPCVMCAMALVHSRVRMVYFVKVRQDGAFTMYKLHERALNYMYRVFRVEREIEEEKEKDLNEGKEEEEEKKELEKGHDEEGSKDAR
jgi:tRNA-specific adenosine deaminase 3